MTATPRLETPQYSPGSLVRARGREWIVLPGSTAEVLRLRPLTGSEEDVAVVHTAVETGVEPAVFPLPPASPEVGQEAALLLRDALLLSLRRGAGPFRSFGNLAFEPRAYQLVPLLMALRLDPVRLLIADDVGIGKTIEAGLIARELLDRGEVSSFTVLCPPHLVDQWVQELRERFHIQATAVTSSSAARLERGLPVNESIFTVYPFTVVSLDYIKSEARRHDVVLKCPTLVVVDEAHTCTNTGAARHLRYELLRDLVRDEARHLVMLTATPHSGDEAAFYHLLGLLHPDFTRLAEAGEGEREELRERLARHFVQRRRPDIDEWRDAVHFPKREIAERTYQLGGAWKRFFDDVLRYCAEITTAAGEDERARRLNFWGTLALMRCVSSSPRAAVQALRTRLGLDVEGEDGLLARLLDGSTDDLPDDDVEPGADGGDPRLHALMAQAQELAGEGGDPKLALVLEHVQKLVAEGFAPVVFCRYVASAHYVADHLRTRLPGVMVEAVTGEFPPEDRVRRIEVLADHEGPHILVATDCLSEGVNLQHAFDAVVHYDLSWNPTRHEQREGRVDRYGQTSKVVRATLIYGANNPVDGAVLKVILRKAESIRCELGVPVPVPDNDHKLTQALLQAVLLRSGPGDQVELFVPEEHEAALELEVRWTSLAEKAKRNRTVFAQRRIKPEEVLPEWRRMQAALGAQEEVKRFVDRAMARHNSGLAWQGRSARAPLDSLPLALRERLAAEGLEGTLRVDFADPPARGARFLHRSHPLVAVLAEDLLERALSPAADGAGQGGLSRLGRAGVWRTAAVDKQTVVLLLRLRHQLTATSIAARGRPARVTTLLVEEGLLVAMVGRQAPALVASEDVATWLGAVPGQDLPDGTRRRVLEEAVGGFAAHSEVLEALALTQAEALLADHRRVRTAAEARGRYEVRALTPVDVIAAYVLLPPA